MAYEKHTWETGEVITAEKLNHVEEGIKGLSDNFFEYRKETVSFYDGTISANIEPDDYIQAYHGDVSEENFSLTDQQTYDVVFDGVAYTATARLAEDPNGNVAVCLGQTDISTSWDFSEYPFDVVANQSGNGFTIYTQIGGEHTLTIQIFTETITLSDAFKKAVLAAK